MFHGVTHCTKLLIDRYELLELDMQENFGKSTKEVFTWRVWDPLDQFKHPIVEGDPAFNIDAEGKDSIIKMQRLVLKFNWRSFDIRSLGHSFLRSIIESSGSAADPINPANKDSADSGRDEDANKPGEEDGEEDSTGAADQNAPLSPAANKGTPQAQGTPEAVVLGQESPGFPQPNDDMDEDIDSQSVTQAQTEDEGGQKPLFTKLNLSLDVKDSVYSKINPKLLMVDEIESKHLKHPQFARDVTDVCIKWISEKTKERVGNFDESWLDESNHLLDEEVEKITKVFDDLFPAVMRVYTLHVDKKIEWKDRNDWSVFSQALNEVGRIAYKIVQATYGKHTGPDKMVDFKGELKKKNHDHELVTNEITEYLMEYFHNIKDLDKEVKDLVKENWDKVRDIYNMALTVSHHLEWLYRIPCITPKMTAMIKYYSVAFQETKSIFSAKCRSLGENLKLKTGKSLKDILGADPDPVRKSKRAKPTAKPDDSPKPDPKPPKKPGSAKKSKKSQSPKKKPAPKKKKKAADEDENSDYDPSDQEGEEEKYEADKRMRRSWYSFVTPRKNERYFAQLQMDPENLSDGIELTTNVPNQDDITSDISNLKQEMNDKTQALTLEEYQWKLLDMYGVARAQNNVIQEMIKQLHGRVSLNC